MSREINFQRHNRHNTGNRNNKIFLTIHKWNEMRNEMEKESFTYLWIIVFFMLFYLAGIYVLYSVILVEYCYTNFTCHVIPSIHSHITTLPSRAFRWTSKNCREKWSEIFIENLKCRNLIEMFKTTFRQFKKEYQWRFKMMDLFDTNF